MNKNDLKNNLHEYVKGKLSPEERLEVEQALVSDGALKAEYENVRKYYRDLGALPEIKAPEDFLLKVRGRIDKPGFFKKVRDLLLYPLHIKLPLEVAATVGLSLLVIVIFNPYAPKIPVKEDIVVVEYGEKQSEVVLSDDNKNNEIDSLKPLVAEKKTIEPQPRLNRTIKAKSTVAEKAERTLDAGRPTARSSASFAEEMPAAQSAKKPPAAPSSSLSGALSVPAPEQYASSYEAHDAAEVSKSIDTEAELPASQPSFASAPAEASAKEMAGSNRRGKKALTVESPIAFTWTPEGQKTSPQFDKKIRAAKSESALDEGPARAKSSSSASSSRELSDAAGYIDEDNVLKSNNMEYLKSSVMRVGGTISVIDPEGRSFRIKVSVSKFKQFKKLLIERGVLSSENVVNTAGYSSRDMIELTVTIVEK